MATVGGGNRRRWRWKTAMRRSVPRQRWWTTARQRRDKSWRQQQNKSKRQMHCWRTRSIGRGNGGWESEANKPNGGRRASNSYSLAFQPINLGVWERDTTTNNQPEIKRGKARWGGSVWEYWKQGQARGRRMWLRVYGKYGVYVLFMILTWQHVSNQRHDTTYDMKKTFKSRCWWHVGRVGLTCWDDTEEMSSKLTFEDIKNVDISS